MSEKPYMTEDQAESIILANAVGRFFGDRSQLTHAHLLLAARDKRLAKLEENETCPVCDGGHGNHCACSCPPAI